MKLEHINELIKDEMVTVNQMILTELKSDVVLINQLSHYIINAGGKRIRPMIAILAALSLNYKGNQHIALATFIEFIHTATLLHDDVIDESDLRRGNPTANACFGNAASVLVGDFIYTRAFQIMTKLNSLRILELMASATNLIAEGEVMQLMNCNNPDITEEDYFDVIYSKTAKLFEVSAQISAILSSASTEQEIALKNYGKHLGTAFQLIDDVLDYSAEQAVLGKNLGDDLNEGKATLPLLHAMWNGNKEQSEQIRQAILQGSSLNLLDSIIDTMQQCGSLKYTQQKAEKEADKAILALCVLPQNEYRFALESLAHIAVHRNF